MRCLVIGYGSIGARHARILAEAGHEVAVVSARDDVPHPAWRAVGDALERERFDYAVVATATARHGAAVDELAGAGFSGRVLVEKPLFDAPRPLPGHRFAGLWVGYQLRFHPVWQALRRELAERTPLAATFHVGQHLSWWRPGRDHRATYSASRAEGGGVLRDLSHELDGATWMLGECTALAAIGGRFAELTLDSDDQFALLAICRGCPLVQVRLSYLDRIVQRFAIVECADATLRADLVAGTLQVDDRVERVAVERDDALRAMHRAILSGEDGDCCDARHGAHVLAVIAAAERAAGGRCWEAP